ncbi:MAG: succinyl-diaminopimelate desuccinylase [Rhodospirillaceae bacterium]|nr:succinyl-diaminopimelate desuccinylase [Rhodospirillaceae bacterium]
MIETLPLAQELIRKPSVTPRDEGALGVLQAALESLGFSCHRLSFGVGAARVDNLYARLGAAAPNFCFAGHTDVVPEGDPSDWTHDPFGGEVKDGILHGRGAADMKGAIAAFVSAGSTFLDRRGKDFGGSISLLITGDEEGDAINGTAKVLEWLDKRGEKLDMCLVGEPTNPEALGDMIKIGRRGSLTGKIIVQGIQGHTAYPHLADNPIHRLVRMLAAITSTEIDDGTEHFQATTLQVSTVDVGNPASNIIPARASATFNSRFNDLWSGETLEAWIRERFDTALCAGEQYDLSIRVSGESFLCPPGPFSDAIADAVEAELGRRPALGTTGGTSDARFLHKYCPIAEFGAIGKSMHKVDEQMPVADLEALMRIYVRVLDKLFPA